MSASSVSGRVVRVVPDVAPLTREFDYLVPPHLDAEVQVGTLVRVNLHGRRVGGWVVADEVTPPPGVTLRPISRVTGWGPSAEVIELARWAAWRWAGPTAALLRSASPEIAVRGLPQVYLPKTAVPAAVFGNKTFDGELVAEALGAGRAIVRLPPAADPLAVVLAASALGPTVVVTPSQHQAEVLAVRLSHTDTADPVAVVPREWPRAAAGAAVVVGARGAAWAPCPGLACVVVLDGHEESLQQQQAPTWNAWVVAAERARRAGVPCVVVSSCPTVEMLAWAGARLVVPSRVAERSGWAALEVVDRRRDDPRSGLYSSRLVRLLKGRGRVVCVLNRKDRVRLLACGACTELVRCERCGATVSLNEGMLTCARCHAVRPSVCLACGSMRLKALRIGVSRAREELEQLVGEPVGQVTAESESESESDSESESESRRRTGRDRDSNSDHVEGHRILVGTEAVLRRVEETDAVAFVDFDQELLAPRYRAAEEAIALLALASRLVGGRARGGRVMVQTRVPQHEVLRSALTADPGRLSAGEALLRQALSLPPVSALAVVSGAAAEEFTASLVGADIEGVDVLGPDRDRWLVKAPDHRRLADALGAVARPPGKRLRLEIDPLRL